MSLTKSILIFCTFFIVPVLSAVAQTDAADKILGTYYISDDTSDEDCKVKITKDKSGTYSGRIIWVKNPYFKDGTPKRDIKNPDPAKRNTPGDQIPLVCKMWFEDDKTLRVRGYIGISALGRTMTWKKL